METVRNKLQILKDGLACLNIKRRIFTLAVIQSCFSLAAFAQDSAAGVSAITEATSSIANYQTPVQKLMYAIAAIIALVGAFNVYHKMTNGDQDVKKTIMLTLGGCVAMVALSTALPAFFK